MSDGLSDKTKKELVDIAKDLHIKNYSKLSKDDLIRAIRKNNAKKEQLNITSDPEKKSDTNKEEKLPEVPSDVIEQKIEPKEKQELISPIKKNEISVEATEKEVEVKKEDAINLTFTNSIIEAKYTEQVDLIDVPSPPAVSNYDSFSEGYIPKKSSYDFTER